MDFKLILEGIAVLGAMGAIFGALLAFAAKIFYVEVDPKQEAVRACLAGANCGGCGYPGCDGYAAAVAAGKAPVNCCVAGGQAAADQIAEIMGVSAGAEEKMVAFVPCSGAEGVAVKRFNYSGPQDCQAAMLFGGKSNKECRFACIGLGCTSSTVSPRSTATSASAAWPAPMPARRRSSSACRTSRPCSLPAAIRTRAPSRARSAMSAASAA